MTAPRWVKLDSGRILADPAMVDLLHAGGMDTFEQVMSRKDGAMMRSVPGRSTVRLCLRRPDGSEQTVFLKRYDEGYLTPFRTWLRWLRWPSADDEARHEWNAILSLADRGFLTARPLAVGQAARRGVVRRSFLLTAEIAGGVAAHDLLRALTAAERRDLLREVALLTRRFHQAGYVHKDFYLSHVFVSPVGPDARALSLIDLQRLARPRWRRWRWQAKDLAAMGYSARLAGASRTDLLRAYLTCAGTPRLTSADRHRLRTVLARIRSLESRRPRHDVIWDQPGVHPPNV